MRTMLARIAASSGLAVVFVVALAAASSGSAGQAVIIGRWNSAGATNTALTAKSSGNSFVLYQNGTGSALRGWAKGSGNGVSASANSSAQGNGVLADNRGGPGSQNFGTAVLGLGNNAWGIVGSTYDPNGVAVDGEDTSDSVNGLGTQGLTGQGVGVLGSAQDKSGPGAGGVFSTASKDSNAWGIVAQGCGVSTSCATSQAALFQGNVRVQGNLTVTGTCNGCAIGAVAVNGTTSTIRRGEAVELLGARAPLTGSTPVLVVGPATADSHVIGIAGGEITPRRTAIRMGSAEPAGPFHHPGAGTVPGYTFAEGASSAGRGRYLAVVTYGIVTGATVDASAGAIHAGDSLAVGPTAGSLSVARPMAIQGRSFTVPGTSVGYALASFSKRHGAIAMLVSPH